MANWSYPKDVAKRTVKVLISVATQGSLEQPWHDDILPFEMNWSDYQTQADSAHNVPEHRWDEGPIKDGASLLANLSKDIEGRVAVFLAGAVANAERTQVLKRFSERGVKVRKKWEQVDAAAFDTVGSRLVDALVHNATLLGNAPLELPVAGYQVARDECMLAVAVAAEGSACPRARESAQV